MATWLPRGLLFAALMVIVRLVQGALINQFETKALLISVSLLLVFAVVVVAWGLIDGRGDARVNPDPDRRADLAMTWLLAGLVAGLVSGLVSWIIALFYDGIYTGGLINEVTTFAAFTALLVFVPAIIAVTVGRWLVDRKAPPFQRRSTGANTDVFTAVGDDHSETPTGPVPTAASSPAAETETRPSSVATAERDPQAQHEEHRTN